MDSKRQVEPRGATRPLQPQRHGDAEETHERLVYSVPPCLRGSSAVNGAEGDLEDVTAPALPDLPKTISRRVHRPAEPQAATRGSREETKNAEKRPGVLHRETDPKCLQSFRLFSCFFGCGLGSRENLAAGNDATGQQSKKPNDQASRCAAAFVPTLRCWRLIPDLRVPRSQLPRWEDSGSTRHHSLNTLVPAVRGSRRNQSAGAEIHRILYGKVPAVRLRTWPHPVADDDHPVGKDQIPFRRGELQEELLAPDPSRPGRVVEGAAGRAREQ